MGERRALPLGPNPTPVQAQCATCRQTFSGITLFDRHRRSGQCIDPREMTGIRQDVKGVWRSADPRPAFSAAPECSDG